MQATALYTAEDTTEARTRLSALHDALAAVEQVRVPFLAAMEDQLPPDRRRRFDLFVKEFIAYQNDTAELGLTISPKAALIQATDEATVKNREHMIAEIGLPRARGAGPAERRGAPPTPQIAAPRAHRPDRRAGGGARARPARRDLDHRHARSRSRWTD